MSRELLWGALLMLVACSDGSGAVTATSVATTPSSPLASSVPMIPAPKNIPDAIATKASICDDARFWAAFINDAEHALYDQGQVTDELRAFLPKLQRDVIAAGGASAQSALAKLVPAGAAVLADKVGSSNWLLDLGTFGPDLKIVLKYLPNCR